MKKQKLTKVILVMLLLTTLLTGCKKGEKASSSEEKTKYYKVSIDGDYEYLQEDNAAVQELSEFAKKFADGCGLRDYTKSEQVSYYSLFIESMANQYKEADMAGRLQASVEADKLLTTMDEVTVQSIDLFTLRGEEAAELVVDFVSTVKEATDSYFEEVGIEANIPYKRTLTISMVKENGEWRTSTFSATSREKVTK